MREKDVKGSPADQGGRYAARAGIDVAHEMGVSTVTCRGPDRPGEGHAELRAQWCASRFELTALYAGRDIVRGEVVRYARLVGLPDGDYIDTATDAIVRGTTVRIVAPERAEALESALRDQLAEVELERDAARREGASAMREACLEACRAALRDPCDIAIIGRVAEAIRALPLPGDDGGAP